MDIRVLPGDKGNAMVVLLNDYRSKLGRRKTALIKKSEISKKGLKRFKLHASKPPRLYGIPKSHKKEVPLSLIVNCFGSPT
jgi:hypothetical protein